jgi:isopropylmalate/homocitrate/citramalate synthase
MGQLSEPSNSWYTIILPFIIPGITAMVVLVKWQGRSDAKAGMADFEIEGIKDDVKEVKSDVKELSDKMSDALRNIDILHIKVENIERYHEDRRRGGSPV